MTKQPGWIFRKRYTHRAIALRKRRQLEAVIDALADRLIEKHFEVTADSKLQMRSRPRGNHDDEWQAEII
jgi:hypothetical protein